MMRFRTWTDFVPELDINGEVNTRPSLTDPTQAMSIQQIVDRFVRGAQVEKFQPVYTDDDLVPANLERMTEIERIDLARDISVALDQQRQRIRAADYRAQAKDIIEPSDPPADADVK